MKGIDCDALEKMKSKIISSSETLNNKYKESDLIYDEITKCYKGEGLGFLTSKLEKQLISIKDSSNKIKKYATIINQVITSYKDQDELLQTNISRAISDRRGDK